MIINPKRVHFSLPSSGISYKPYSRNSALSPPNTARKIGDAKSNVVTNIQYSSSQRAFCRTGSPSVSTTTRQSNSIPQLRAEATNIQHRSSQRGFQRTQTTPVNASANQTNANTTQQGIEAPNTHNSPQRSSTRTPSSPAKVTPRQRNNSSVLPQGSLSPTVGQINVQEPCVVPNIRHTSSRQSSAPTHNTPVNIILRQPDAASALPEDPFMDSATPASVQESYVVPNIRRQQHLPRTQSEPVNNTPRRTTHESIRHAAPASPSYHHIRNSAPTNDALNSFNDLLTKESGSWYISDRRQTERLPNSRTRRRECCLLRGLRRLGTALFCGTCGTDITLAADSQIYYNSTLPSSIIIPVDLTGAGEYGKVVFDIRFDPLKFLSDAIRETLTTRFATLEVNTVNINIEYAPFCHTFTISTRDSEWGVSRLHLLERLYRELQKPLRHDAPDVEGWGDAAFYDRTVKAIQARSRLPTAYDEESYRLVDCLGASSFLLGFRPIHLGEDSVTLSAMFTERPIPPEDRYIVPKVARVI